METDQAEGIRWRRSIHITHFSTQCNNWSVAVFYVWKTRDKCSTNTTGTAVQTGKRCALTSKELDTITHVVPRKPKTWQIQYLRKKEENTQ